MSDYERIAGVIRYLDERHVEQPDLAALARRARLSRHHFHRLFSRWAGVTPKDFLQSLTLAHARELLSRGDSVLDSALEAGLSGPGRLHDLCVSLAAASPGEVKSGGAGWTIAAGFADTPFGTCLVGESPRGICHVSFVEACDRRAGAETIGKDWPSALIEWDDSAAARIADLMFDRTSSNPERTALRAVVRGSAFQVKVWRALLDIPRGALSSYGRIADVVCTRKASRAVGAAVGANRLAYLIPCHRVIRETGVFGDYRWGAQRKRAMIAWETAEAGKENGRVAAEKDLA